MNRILIILIISLILGCDKDNDQSALLPEETQTGRGIFACYIDGKPFIDNGGSANGISFNCFYQLIDGEYYFGIQGQDRVNDLISVALSTNSLEITEFTTYDLLDYAPGKAGGACSFNPEFGIQEPSQTNVNFTGQMQITRFDLQNQIISGTFEFDIEDPFTGDTVKITQGRFDTHFGL